MQLIEEEYSCNKLGELVDEKYSWLINNTQLVKGQRVDEEYSCLMRNTACLRRIQLVDEAYSLLVQNTACREKIQMFIVRIELVGGE
jgi:hypothetical protein